ncbi:MAG: hypothetical protein KAJ76_10960 [Candidatus Heimdallarchaeota archaeon]|nr:hypothetical protein [Candidatus Heimdallarchaeota archaeon]MCK5299419.1 hypothetical protein [Candidatus Heimdallarchaeota archaeon]
MKKKRISTHLIHLYTIILVLTSTLSFVEINGEVRAEAINTNYSLPLQSWTFIHEVNLTENQVTRYLWVSDISVQGREVNKVQFNTMQGQSLSERSAYFETIGYFDGTQDSGKTTTDINGSIYFVFFNPNSSHANLDLTYTYQSNNIQPWVIGLISGIGILLLVIIGMYVAAKIRRKMLKDAEEEQEPSAAERYMNM